MIEPDELGIGGDGEPDCFAAGEVNQQALFARVATVVHHSGAGTTTVRLRPPSPSQPRSGRP